MCDGEGVKGERVLASLLPPLCGEAPLEEDEGNDEGDKKEIEGKEGVAATLMRKHMEEGDRAFTSLLASDTCRVTMTAGREAHACMHAGQRRWA